VRNRLLSASFSAAIHAFPRDGLLVVRLALALGLCVAAITALPAQSATLSQPFRNLTNQPFATVSGGPQCGYVVEVGREPTPATLRAHLAKAASEASSRLRSLRPLLDFLRTKADYRSDPSLTEVIWLTSDARLLPSASSAAASRAGGDLVFTFSGWSPAEQAFLSATLTQAYSLAKDLYGPPAFALTIEVVRDPSITSPLGGLYVPATDQILMRPLSGNAQQDEFVAVQLMLHAFRDSLILYYDAWEKGMVRAAAQIITRQLDPAFHPLYEPFYLMPLYDLLNQPALGNPTFAAGSDYQAMLPWRVGMAAAVWLKVFAEYPTFFRDFNAAYYTAADPTNPVLAGDVPRLRAIAAACAPLVEGRGFQEWLEQQWVMDTSVTLGPKLFIYPLPLQEILLLVLDYYDTLAAGNESPRAGVANLAYYDYTHTYSLFAQEGYQILIPGTGDDAGQGFLAPTFYNVGGPQRLSVEISLDAFFRVLHFPYGVRASDGQRAPLYGFVQGDNGGELSVTGLPGSTAAARVVHGAIYQEGIYPISAPCRAILAYTNSVGQLFEFRRNLGWGYYVAALQGGGQRQQYHRILTPGPSGVVAFSLPFSPQNPEPSTVLGLPPDRILLADYRQSVEGGGAYRLYPEVAALQPGRGYLLKTDSEVTISAAGTAVSTAQPFVIELSPGWNLIGNPHEEPVQVSALRFARGSQGPLSFAQAVSLGWLGQSVFEYSAEAGPSAADRLEPWRAYWVVVKIEGGVRMLVTAP